jgi:hypothetical protein
VEPATGTSPNDVSEDDRLNLVINNFKENENTRTYGRIGQWMFEECESMVERRVDSITTRQFSQRRTKNSSSPSYKRPSWDLHKQERIDRLDNITERCLESCHTHRPEFVDLIPDLDLEETRTGETWYRDTTGTRDSLCGTWGLWWRLKKMRKSAASFSRTRRWVSFWR